MATLQFLVWIPAESRELFLPHSSCGLLRGRLASLERDWFPAVSKETGSYTGSPFVMLGQRPFCEYMDWVSPEYTAVPFGAKGDKTPAKVG